MKQYRFIELTKEEMELHTDLLFTGLDEQNWYTVKKTFGIESFICLQ